MKTNLKTLSISTSYPTFEGVPTDDAAEITLVDPGKTKTRVGWPLNWRQLSPKWRGLLAAHLCRRVIDNVLVGDQAAFDVFMKATGWGNKK